MVRLQRPSSRLRRGFFISFSHANLSQRIPAATVKGTIPEPFRASVICAARLKVRYTGDRMVAPKQNHLCWICRKPVDVGTCKIDKYGEAVHEACNGARVALENLGCKAPVSSSAKRLNVADISWKVLPRNESRCHHSHSGSSPQFEPHRAVLAHATLLPF